MVNLIPKIVLNHKNLGKAIKPKHRLLLGILINLCDKQTGKVVVKYSFSPFKLLWDLRTHKNLVKHLISNNILEVLTEDDDAMGYNTYMIKDPNFWCNKYLEAKETGKNQAYKDEVDLLYSKDQKAERNRRLMDRRRADIKAIISRISSLTKFSTVMTNYDYEDKAIMILKELYTAGILDSCLPAKEMALKLIRQEYVRRDEIQDMVNFATRENNIILSDAEAEKMAMDRLQELGLTAEEAYGKLEDEKNGIRTNINMPQFDPNIITSAPKKNKPK